MPGEKKRSLPALSWGARQHNQAKERPRAFPVHRLIFWGPREWPSGMVWEYFRMFRKEKTTHFPTGGANPSA